MRYIDFAVQTLLILFGIGLLVFAASTEESYPVVLIAQLFLGPWQVISSIGSVSLRGNAYKFKIIHLIGSAVYFAVLFIAMWIGLKFNYHWNDETVMSYLIIPPWLLAFYYYRITWRIAFPIYKKSSSFLPHINF
jgi:heme A synthase